MAVFGMLLVGCPQADDSGNASNTDPTSESDSDEEESDSEPETSATTMSTATDTDPMTSSESSGGPGSSEETGPPIEGPGCGITPVCDKGELSGSAQIMSSDDIAMLEGYTSVSGWIEIFNTDLVCLDFIACLETVGHDITLFGNNSLVDFSGFNALTETGTFDGTDGFISIAEHEALIEINGFANIERLSESLSISENPNLTTVSGFKKLVVIENDINIQFNPLLTDLGGLSNLAALGNECIITNNEELCTSETAKVCGDLQQPPAEEGPPPGNTANNKDGC